LTGVHGRRCVGQDRPDLLSAAPGRTRSPPSRRPYSRATLTGLHGSNVRRKQQPTSPATATTPAPPTSPPPTRTTACPRGRQTSSPTRRPFTTTRGGPTRRCSALGRAAMGLTGFRICPHPAGRLQTANIRGPPATDTTHSADADRTGIAVNPPRTTGGQSPGSNRHVVGLSRRQAATSPGRRPWP